MKISWIEEGRVAGCSVPVGRKDIVSLVDQGIRGIITLTEHPITIQKELSLAYFDEIEVAYLHAPVVDHYPPDLPTMWRVIARASSSLTAK